MKKIKRHYVNNKDLYNALVEWREYDFDPKVRLFKYKIPNPLLKYDSYRRRDLKDITPEIVVNVADYVAYGIQLIANNMSKKSNFSRYSFREEMISEGIMDCIRYGIRNFDPKYTNPFAYFSQIITEAFKRVIKSEKAKLYHKYKTLQDAFIVDDHNELYTQRVTMHDNINKYISDFEDRLKEKRNKAKLKPVGLELFYESNNHAIAEAHNTTDNRKLD